MKKELEIIKENLEATLEGFKDAYETEGYDLANETYYVETALKQVDLLLLHIVSNNEVEYCPECDFQIAKGSGICTNMNCSTNEC